MLIQNTAPVTTTRAVALPEPEPAQHEQVWFGPPERPLFGWLSAPTNGTCRGGVVLCPAVGAELFRTHRTIRRTAEALAGAGFLALRFDYDGTGDSAGEQGDPDRVEAWLASIAAARAHLRGLGADRVSVVGVRLGATLAAAEAATSPDRLCGLVLWDPCGSGSAYLREGEALLEFGEEAVPGPRDPAWRHTPGFQFPVEVGPALRKVDLGRLPTDRRLAERVLLLSRSDRPLATGVTDRLAHEHLDAVPALDQDRLLDVPTAESDVPARSLAQVIDWLCGVHGDRRTPFAGGATGEQVRIPVGGGTVLERAVRVGPGLAGVVTEPVTGPAEGPWPWVLMVNVAADHHIGPGRRWVDLARTWAGQGRRSLRLDLSGIGDSPTHPDQLEARPFAPDWIDDLPAVIRELRADGSPVVVVGLCSGAYSAFEATQWTDVDAVFAVNPRLTLFPAARGTPMFTPRRRAAVVPAVPIDWVGPRRRRLATLVWRAYRQVAVWNAPARVLRRVARSGAEVEILACPDDVRELTGIVAWRPVLGRLRRSGRLRLVEDPLLDHSLLTKVAQDQVAAAAGRFLDDVLPGLTR